MRSFGRFLACMILLSSAIAIADDPDSIAASTDVAWLESIVNWQAGGDLSRPGTLAGGFKDLRTSAYARLGELGTPQSLAAVRRIENAAKTPWKQRTMRFDRWTHPCWHFSDFQEEQKVGMLDVGQGLTYLIVNDRGLMGDDDWFLLSAPTSRWVEWNGAWLIPKPASPSFRTLNLVFARDRGILVAFTKTSEAMVEPLNPPAAGAVPKIRLDGVTKWIPVQDIVRDSDGDGWTDVEEDRMGLDAHERDSDGDGLHDGEDPCPDYAPGPKDDSDEDVKILQKAIFATFGLSGSRDLLFVREGSRKLQVWGYEGPILYKVKRADWTKHHLAGIWVDWKIDSKKDDTAEVGIGDYEGPLAAGGQTVTLRRISGEWFVIKRETGPVA